MTSQHGTSPSPAAPAPLLPSHLRWPGLAGLPRDVQGALTGPGAPFEIATEPVLGHDHQVFARRPRTLRQMLDGQAASTPDLPFLIAPGRQWTYREALADIDAMARLLRDRYGVRAGDRVAIVAANHAEYAILMWATVTLGAIVASLNGWWTAPELDYGISLTTPLLVAGDERRLARLADGIVPGGVPVRRLGELLREAQERRRPASCCYPEDTAQPGITEDSPAVILFTSGTTGRPKGATLSHRNIINFAMVNRLAAATGAMATASAPVARTGAPAHGCTIVSSPMFHVSGMIAVLITGAAFPVSLVFPRPGPWDPLTWLELAQRHKVTSLSGVPTQFWRLLRHPDLDKYDLSSVATVGGGGAVCPPELVRELHARFPQVRLGNGYGMSETVGLGTLTGGDAFVAIPESVGPAQATVEVQVRGPDGTVLPEGETGEICLRTPSVFLGYWNDAAATGAALDGDRWYQTGDFGRVSGGLLYLESRRRDLILRGGENIYPVEIENRLVEHPDIDDAAVIGVGHPELGQEPKAFVVRRPGAALTAVQVRAWCAAALAGFKVPAQVEFRDALPYTQTGKLLKQELEREEEARRSSSKGRDTGD
jgi:acyl-CoA synthetase (AMP-forming)/AMP-acid ligase II